jgi:hypothetical protein
MLSCFINDTKIRRGSWVEELYRTQNKLIVTWMQKEEKDKNIDKLKLEIIYINPYLDIEKYMIKIELDNKVLFDTFNKKDREDFETKLELATMMQTTEPIEFYKDGTNCIYTRHIPFDGPKECNKQQLFIEIGDIIDKKMTLNVKIEKK